MRGPPEADGGTVESAEPILKGRRPMLLVSNWVSITDGISGVVEGGMPRRNAQRKHGTTRGPRRFGAQRRHLGIGRSAAKSRCVGEWGGWGRLSDDGSGQHNPDPSEDPGVERWKLLARWCFTERMAPALNGGTVPPRRARRARQTACAGWRGKASSDMPALKPYWGKLAVRNFREGAGDVTHGRLPFATQLERADTWEATHLLVGAPVLYSTEANFAKSMKVD